MGTRGVAWIPALAILIVVSTAGTGLAQSASANAPDSTAAAPPPTPPPAQAPDSTAAAAPVTPPPAQVKATPAAAPTTPPPTQVQPAPTSAPAAAPTSPPPAQVQATASSSNVRPSNAGVFSRGQKRMSVVGGWGQSYNDDYLILGVGIGYFLMDGLEAGLDFESWLVGDPTIYKLSPQVRYTLWQVPRMKPYVGGFYRRTYVSDFDDLDSMGGRVGAFYSGRGRTMVGAGAVYERYMDCDESVVGSCDEIYPEFIFAMYF
jgi:hypothetical protein